MWYTDRHLGAIALDQRDNLGAWIVNRRKHCRQESIKSKAVVSKCDMTVAQLREQWKLQKSAQLSIRGCRSHTFFE